MNLMIIAVLLLVLGAIYMDARMRTERHLQCIADEKSDIAKTSGMTASIGVFYPNVSTTVVIGASEDTGACYYRVLREGKVINRSRINLAKIVRVELLVNGERHALDTASPQASSFLKATDIASRSMSIFSSEELRATQRAGLRIVFLNESGEEKMLEITVLRMGDERHRYKRMELFKDAVWWTVFLDNASANARRIWEYLAAGDAEEPEEKIT